MVAGGDWCVRWWGSTWNAEGVPVQAMFVGDIGRGPGEMGSEETGHGQGLEEKDMIDPGDRRDGAPVGADLASGSWSARVRLGFCQPVRLAHLCRAGCCS